MKKLLGFIILLVSLAFAQAQQIVISPRSIVVNPLPSFEVDVFVDKDPSGDGSPSYQIGERISIGVRVSESSFVYLYSVKSNGQVVQILPNRFDQDNFVRAGETRRFPPSGARYSFTVDGPRGVDKVIAVASRSRLNTDRLARFEANASFATSNIGQDGFAGAFSIVVEPIGQRDWVTDTALFVVGPPVPPPFATLSVDSIPSGAEVFVDGRFVGFTPLRYDTDPGRHDVTVSLDGYRTFSQSISVGAGETFRINAVLAEIPRFGTLVIRANVGGAQVFLDGEFSGNIPSGSGVLVLSDLRSGTHEVTIVAPGYRSVVEEFRIRGGETEELRVRQRRIEDN
ncbi:MAG: PEGA domain-containing protein [Trueperaceae bacterium]|nr:MAG: PEGA domain-containing protein [Trueperaceae bacterium]